MFGDGNYDRLMAEYRFCSNANTRTVTKPDRLFNKMMMFTAGTVIMLIMGFAGIDGDKWGSDMFVFILPVVAGLIAVGAREKNKWDKTAELIKLSVASYECTVTDCGYTLMFGRNSGRKFAFKFAYIRNGVTETDMCALNVLWYNATIDMNDISIALYETRGGEKVVSVFIPKMGEYRQICK